MNFPEGGQHADNADIVFDETQSTGGTETPVDDVSSSEQGDDIDFENLNVEELPLDQQDLGRKLKAGFTKKTQAIAAERQALSDKAKKYDDLEAMLSNPEQRKIFVAAMTANQGDDTAQVSHAHQPWGDIDPAKEFAPEVHKAVMRSAYDVVGMVLSPILQRLEQKEKMLEEIWQERATTRATAPWDGLSKQFKNANEFKDSAVALSQKTGITIEQALYAVGGGKLQKASTVQDSQVANNQVDKRRSVLTRNGAPAANGRSPIGRRTTLEMLLEAQKELGMR